MMVLTMILTHKRGGAFDIYLMTGKQRAIDLATKMAIINAVETGIETKSEIARCYKLPRSTLSTILKNKEKFKHLFATSSNAAG